MFAGQQIELAGLVASHGPGLIEADRPPSPSAIDQYWIDSRDRLDRWAHTLKAHRQNLQCPSVIYTSDAWRLAIATIEEIIVSDVLTRVWTAVLTACDLRRETAVAEPVVRSIYVGHMELRNRALSALVELPGIDPKQALRINRLRRRCEGWLDLLLGHLHHHGDVRQFAVDPQRVQQHAEDLAFERSTPDGHHAWPLLLTSLRVAFPQRLGNHSGNNSLNARIANSILACFPSEVFDSTGLFKSLWLVRMTNTTQDAQGMIDHLLFDDDSSAAEQSPDKDSPLGSFRRFKSQGS